MSDDTCKPHQHYGKGADSYTCHHFFPIAAARLTTMEVERDPWETRTPTAVGAIWRCLGCGGERESVTSRDAGRKYKDRIDP